MRTLTLRTAAASLAIVATLMRAVLPDGWMPRAAQDGVSLVICTMTGPAHIVLGTDGKPIKQQPTTPERERHLDTCPFAAAVHWAAPTSVFHLVPLALLGVTVDHAPTQTAIDTPTRLGPQSPRAPPIPV
jgi:hypothetical protein